MHNSCIMEIKYKIWKSFVSNTKWYIQAFDIIILRKFWFHLKEIPFIWNLIGFFFSVMEFIPHIPLHYPCSYESHIPYKEVNLYLIHWMIFTMLYAVSFMYSLFATIASLSKISVLIMPNFRHHYLSFVSS